MNEAVLEGHLGIAKELVSFMSSDKKFELGSDESTRIFLIKVNAVFLSLPLFFIEIVCKVAHEFMTLTISVHRKLWKILFFHLQD